MPLGFKRWIDENGDLHGRLEIGFMRQGLGYAYYEPIGGKHGDRGPEIGIFHESRGYKTANPNRDPPKGSLESWSPAVHDVYWYPWAQPFPGESSNKKGMDIIHRRDLFDMHCYLMATDPEEIAERARGLDVPGKMRRWAFYQIAAPWKRKELQQRQAKGMQTNTDPQDVVLSDSEDEDEGFEVDEEERSERTLTRKRRPEDTGQPGLMGPPGRPASSNKRPKPNAASTRRSRNLSRPASNYDDDDALYASGALGVRSTLSQASSNRSRSVSILNGCLGDVDSTSPTFDTQAPYESDATPASDRVDLPFTSRRANRSSAYATDRAEPTIETSTGIDNEISQARQRRIEELQGANVNDNEAVARLIHQQNLDAFASGFHNGAFGPTPQTQRSGQSGLPRQIAGTDQYEEYNGGFDEEEAVHRAREASLAAETSRMPRSAGAGIRPTDPDADLHMRGSQLTGSGSIRHPFETDEEGQVGGEGGEADEEEDGQRDDDPEVEPEE